MGGLEWQGRARESADGLRSRERSDAVERLREAAERDAAERASAGKAPETGRIDDAKED